MSRGLRCLAAWAAAGMGSLAAAQMPAAPADGALPVPLSVPVQMGLGFETVRLPGGERMGLAAGQLLFQIGPDWWLGPVAYGAATGQRGGFFVGGVELQRRWALGGGLGLAAGLSLGGGGGAAAPVGDGLMLRPALTLLQAWGPLQAGLSLSEVRFPGTAIRSRQAGLVLGWAGSFDHLPLASVGQRVPADQRSGLGVDAMALTVMRHQPHGAGNTTLPFLLLGTRLDRRFAGIDGSWGLEAAAAAQGRAAGYMEILAHAGLDWQPLQGLRLGLRGAAGLGGGGAVPAGGGGLLRLDGTLAVNLHPGWQVGASWGRTQGRTPAMDATRSGLWLAADLEPLASPGTPGRAGTVQRTSWGGGLLHMAPVQRRDGSRQALDAITLVLERWIGPHAYASGQAWSALGGAAGGYSVGLVGGGLATAARPGGWQFGAELLAGGAGGGGVAGVAGALLNAQAWAALPLGDGAQHTGGDNGRRLRIGLGAVAAQGGGGARPVLSLTWQTAFGQPGP